MSDYETPGVYQLPPLEGSIQGRFDGMRHPLLAELNQRLDRHGSLHGHGGGTYYDPTVGGDPFYLSENLSTYAKKLSEAGEDELALEVLDVGVVWPETQIHGAMYQDLAVTAAQHGKIGLALAIALDNNRMLAGKGAKHFDEVLQDENASYRKAEFISEWLSGASRIYEAVVLHGVDSDNAARRQLLKKVGHYVGVLTDQVRQEGFPKSKYASSEGVNELAIGIGSVCISLIRAQENKVAAQLEGLDPDIERYARAT